MRHELPTLGANGDCFVFFVRSEFLPLIAGELCTLEQEHNWITADYEQAYNIVVEMEAQMALLCASDIIESNNRLYRIIDAGLFGHEYDAGADPPDTITPVIPDVPDVDAIFPGLLSIALDTRHLLDNAINGAIVPGYSNPVSFRDQLQAIIDGLAASDDEFDDIISQLEAIALLLA